MLHCVREVKCQQGDTSGILDIDCYMIDPSITYLWPYG